MNIAIYAIAKNEAKFAARFAATCRDANLTFVLDTGSTDQTVAILTDHGVQVVSATIDPWRFDWARNRALELVPQDVDICLKLDLDECLLPNWREQLESVWVPGITTQAWYTYTWNWKSPGVPQQRFLQNHCHARSGFTWKHRCHEALYLSGKSAQTITLKSMHIEHHPDPTKSRGGYLALLEAEHRSEPSARSLFYLGREYYFVQRFDEAEGLLREYLERSHFPEERGLACRYLYLITREHHWAYRAAAESPTRQHQMLAAKAALNEYDGAAGLHWCSLAIKSLPRFAFGEQMIEDPEIFDTAAECAWQMGMAAEAFSYLERASQLDPRPSRANKYRSWASANSTLS